MEINESALYPDTLLKALRDSGIPEEELETMADILTFSLIAHL